MKLKLIFLFLSFAYLCNAQQPAQADVKTEYHFAKAGKDSGQVIVRTILNGKDTSDQFTTSLNVKNLASEKAAQKAEVLRMLQQIEKEYDFLMDIFYNVRQEEEKHKKAKK
jgi:hypothetical protein